MLAAKYYKGRRGESEKTVISNPRKYPGPVQDTFSFSLVALWSVPGTNVYYCKRSAQYIGTDLGREFSLLPRTLLVVGTAVGPCKRLRRFEESRFHRVAVVGGTHFARKTKKKNLKTNNKRTKIPRRYEGFSVPNGEQNG